MTLDTDIIRRLIDYLRSHSYPESSFAIEYSIGNHKVDLAILDPKTKLPVILFQIQPRENDIQSGVVHQPLKSLIEFLDYTIPAYHVYPITTDPFFDFERIHFN